MNVSVPISRGNWTTDSRSSELSSSYGNLSGGGRWFRGRRGCCLRCRCRSCCCRGVNRFGNDRSGCKFRRRCYIGRNLIVGYRRVILRFASLAVERVHQVILSLLQESIKIQSNLIHSRRIFRGWIIRSINDSVGSIRFA